MSEAAAGYRTRQATAGAEGTRRIWTEDGGMLFSASSTEGAEDGAGKDWGRRRRRKKKRPAALQLHDGRRETRNKKRAISAAGMGMAEDSASLDDDLAASWTPPPSLPSPTFLSLLTLFPPDSHLPSASDAAGGVPPTPSGGLSVGGGVCSTVGRRAGTVGAGVGMRALGEACGVTSALPRRMEATLLDDAAPN